MNPKASYSITFRDGHAILIEVSASEPSTIGPVGDTCKTVAASQFASTDAANLSRQLMTLNEAHRKLSVAFEEKRGLHQHTIQRLEASDSAREEFQSKLRIAEEKLLNWEGHHKAMMRDKQVELERLYEELTKLRADLQGAREASQRGFISREDEANAALEDARTQLMTANTRLKETTADLEKAQQKLRETEKAYHALSARHDDRLIEVQGLKSELANARAAIPPSIVRPAPEMVNGYPRRSVLHRLTPAELAIHQAVQAVEDVVKKFNLSEVSGASEALTDAVILLGKAQDRVADHVENPEHKAS